MNTVLYTQDFEPITVLDLPLWLLEKLEKTGAIHIRVLLDAETTRMITVWCVRIMWIDQTVKNVLVTGDEELALSLSSEPLPGQQQTYLRYRKIIRDLTQKLVKEMRK